MGRIERIGAGRGQEHLVFSRGPGPRALFRPVLTTTSSSFRIVSTAEYGLGLEIAEIRLSVHVLCAANAYYKSRDE